MKTIKQHQIEFDQKEKLELNRQLMEAVSDNQLWRCQSLLGRGADINTKNEHGTTPLCKAADYGYAAICLELMIKGADVNAKNEWDRSSLDYAISAGHSNISLMLLERGATVNPLPRTHCGTPLRIAAQKGLTEVCLDLLARGAMVNAITPGGMTPLHEACVHGHVDICVILLEHGADIHYAAYKSKGAIEIALANKHEAVASVLRAWLAREAAQTALNELSLESKIKAGA